MGAGPERGRAVLAGVGRHMPDHGAPGPAPPWRHATAPQAVQEALAIACMAL